MSQWTHVHGVIRFDFLRMALPRPNFEALLGKTQTLHAMMAAYDRGEDLPDIETKLPEGSEGTLEWLLWENPDKNHLAAFTVTVFGDLRDYGQPDVDRDLIPWWNAVTLNNPVQGLMVRNAVLCVDVEGVAGVDCYNEHGQKITFTSAEPAEAGQ